MTSSAHRSVKTETAPPVTVDLNSINARVLCLEKSERVSSLTSRVSIITAIAACLSAAAALWGIHSRGSEYRALLDSVGYNFEIVDGTLRACPLSTHLYPIERIQISPKVEVRGRSSSKSDSYSYSMTPSQVRNLYGPHYCFEATDIISRICAQHKFKQASTIHRIDLTYLVGKENRTGFVMGSLGTCEGSS